MKKSLETLYCPECGGTNVQIMAWVDANTNKYCSDVNNPPECEDTWCDDCEEHTGLRTLEELWEDFSEIGVDNDDNITSDFMCFPVGTSKLMFGTGLMNGVRIICMTICCTLKTIKKWNIH